jgi:MEKHLA domain
MTILAIPSIDNNYHREHVSIMLEQLKKWSGKDLVAEYGFSLDTLGEQVFNANFYLLSHDRAADPILTYGNNRVLELWEVDWEELTKMHSRDTAKPVDRQERSVMMAQVKRANYLSGYSGIRVSKTGKEFKILDGIIWNMCTDNGDFYGQAAWFRSVERCRS